MPDRKHFHELAMERLQETRLLILNGRYTGARYLSGYIIEAALKSRICKILDSEYPETGEISKSFLTHKFDLLIKLGGLQKLLDEEKQKNPQFAANWSLLSGWKESDRYNKVDSSSKPELEEILSAIEDHENGILNWIKKLW
ncbi:MAG: hypothetical protein KBF32_07230 [Chitinophagales bacterium]|nr:hypothetical protein [Chitinophagaceae bacterium]MBP9883177.1 hypothetical protein [Chitinophagales bacterium]